VSFAKEAHDWEMDVFASLFQVLHLVFVSIGCKDRLWWVSSKRGLFKVNSLACFEGSRFPWKCVCRTQAPLGFFSFSWSAFLGKILTEDNLRKRHVIIVDRWCLCKRYVESVDHFLLHCDMTSAL